MDKLKTLLSKCKNSVAVIINEHRNVYGTVEEELEHIACLECPPKITDEVKQKMIETDTIVNVVFFPDTPLGNYDVYHYDLDAALDEALSCLNGKSML